MRTLTIHLTWIVLTTVLVASSASAEPIATFDHGAQADASTSVELTPGDRVEVLITNTCPDTFDYVSVAYKDRAGTAKVDQRGCDATAARDELTEAGFCVLKSRPISFVHESGVDAYRIGLTKKSDQPAKVRGVTEDAFEGAIRTMTADAAATCTIPSELFEAPELVDRQYLVRVSDSPWALGMSGGVTVSDVTDPRFAIVPDPNSTTTPPATTVIRDRDAEDSSNLGFAGFLHLHNKRWVVGDSVSFTPTLGLGLAEDNEISAFVGVGIGAWDIGYINIGWNWRPVDTLPPGQDLGAPPISDNALSDLPTRVDDGWFVGFSFKLMSPGESFFRDKIVTPKVEPPNDERN